MPNTRRCGLRVAQVERLEAEIDVMNKDLEALRSFILPGGSKLAAHLHVCRTVARRAERLATDLSTAEDVNPAAVKYLNRPQRLVLCRGPRGQQRRQGRRLVGSRRQPLRPPAPA